MTEDTISTMESPQPTAAMDPTMAAGAPSEASPAPANGEGADPSPSGMEKGMRALASTSAAPPAGEPSTPANPFDEPPKEEEASYEVVHLGRRQKMKLPELISAAQKGMDYDFVRRERDLLRSERVLSETHGNDMGGLYRRAAEMSLKLRAYEEREQKLNDWRDFCAQYPAVDIKSLPRSVLAAIAAGEKPKEAYARYENSELKTELLALKQDAKNRGQFVGSVRSEGEGMEADAFLSGLLGAL